MVFFFNQTVKNVRSNYIPREIITCDDRDPPGINNTTKDVTQVENTALRITKAIKLI